MADPLSIASGVAGIVSLGMTVCQGLMEYYGAWKGYEADVTAIMNSIDHLFRTLQQFEDRLGDTTHLKKDAVDSLERSINACRYGVSELEKKLGKIRDRGRPGKLGMLEYHSRRALYPFKTSTLAKLQEIVGELRQNMMFAAGVLQLDSNILTAQKLDEISSGMTVLGEKITRLHLATAIKDWLKAPDPSSNYNMAVEKRESTTGEWFVLNDDFKTWLDHPASLIWLHGGAGCGKTVLSSTIITATQLSSNDSDTTAVIYYFFDFNDPAKQRFDNLIPSLVQQLAVRDAQAQSVLERLYDRHESGSSRPPTDQFLETFRDMLQTGRSEQVYLIIDALDECSSVEDLLENVLRRIILWRLPKLHILTTSRLNKEIQMSFDELSVLHLPIQSSVVDNDIKTFVTKQMLRDRWWNKWTNAIRQEVIDSLTQKANGMFRWAVCQLQELRKSINVKMLRRLLSGLPRTLDDTYKRILGNVDSEYTEYAIRLFPWLCFTLRPSTLEEVNEMLATKPSTEYTIDEEEFFDDPYDLQQICFSLLTITSEPLPHLTSSAQEITLSPVLRLAHYSVKEFLLSDRLSGPIATFKVAEADAHAMITEICIKALLRLNDLDPYSLESLATRPLAQYAARYWFEHFRKSLQTSAAEKLSRMALILLRSDSVAFESMLTIYDIDSAQPFTYGVYSNPISPFYYVAATGLHTLAEVLLRQDPLLSRRKVSEGLHGSPLKAAICNNDIFMVRTLLQHGISISEDRDIERPHKLTRAGTVLIIEPAAYGHSPLAAAVDENHEHIVDLVLDHMEPGLAGYSDCEVALRILESRSEEISMEIIGKILQLTIESANLTSEKKPANEGVFTKYIGSCTRVGNAKLMQAMLTAGADPNTRVLGYTILYEACKVGSYDCVRILLSAGADIHSISPRGETHFRINSSTTRASSQDEEETCLHATAKSPVPRPCISHSDLDTDHKTWKIINLLLDSGGNPDAPCCTGQTPISLWFHWSPLRIVREGKGTMYDLKTTIARKSALLANKDMSNTWVAFAIQFHAILVVRRAMRRRLQRKLQRA